MYIYGSVGPFHLMEVPTTRLPNIKNINVAPLELQNAYLLLRQNHTLPLYHAFVIDMVLAMGHGIPAPSEAIDVKHQSALLGGDGDSNAIKHR